jgi:hypothetical protein
MQAGRVTASKNLVLLEVGNDRIYPEAEVTKILLFELLKV